MRRALVAAALVLLVAPARQAAAVCTAAEVMSGCGGSCTASCTASACTISRTVTVTPPSPGASCTFDFGTRDVTLQSGGFVGGSSTFEIRAHKLTVGSSGKLTATGGTSGPGGIVTLTLGTGGFVVQTNAAATPVDVSGAGAGSLTVNADGDVSISKAISADASTVAATAGSILITAGRRSGTSVVASGSISLLGGSSSGLSATTTTASAQLGGTISLTAIGVPPSGKIDLENAVDVSGGTAGGGSITITSDGDTILGVTPKSHFLFADGFGDAGSGGSIDVFAEGKIDSPAGMNKPISAVGHSAATSGNPGGAGGSITFEADSGLVNLSGASTGGAIAADAAAGSCGGSVSVTQDTAVGAAVTIAVPITVAGLGISGSTGTTSDGNGGSLCVDTGDPTTITQLIDGTGGGGGGGFFEIDTVGTLTVNGAIHTDGTGGGGCVTLCSAADIAVNAAVTAVRQLTNATTGSGGGVTALADGAISVNALVDVSTTGSNSAGCADLEAGRNLTVTSTAVVDADGGSATNSSGGAITLVSGSPDLPGDLTLNGRAHAIGRSTLPNAFGTADLDGCTVHIASTGIVDTTGDQQAHNTLTARKALVVDSGAQIKTTGGSSASRNFLILPTGSTPPTTGTFSPPLAPSDETFLPPCTAPAQTGCLTPCPVCGNHAVEFPETCDNGGAPNACCDATCRAPNCNDGNACTTDSCSPTSGCTNTPITGCTTTTTSTTIRTTTTTIRTTTTTTILTSTTTLSTTTTTANTTTTTVATTTTTVATTTSTTTTTIATTTTSTTTTPTSTTTTSTTTSTTSTSTTSTSSTTTTTATTTTTTSGVPFGGDDTGCVPDTKNHLKCGDSIGKAVGKAIRAVIKCHQKQADAAFATLNGKVTTFDEELCEEGPNGGKSAKEKFEAAIAKIGPSGKNLCTSQQLALASSQETALFAGKSNAASLDALNGQVYCDGSASIDPSGDDAGTIDPSGLTGKLKLKCADTLGRELGKLAAAAIVCHQKQADSGFAGKVFQEEVCEESDPAKHRSALEKYRAAMDKLDAKGICTQTCLSRPNRDALGANVLGQIESANQVAYPCP